MSDVAQDWLCKPGPCTETPPTGAGILLAVVRPLPPRNCHPISRPGFTGSNSPRSAGSAAATTATDRSVGAQSPASGTSTAAAVPAARAPSTAAPTVTAARTGVAAVPPRRTPGCPSRGPPSPAHQRERGGRVRRGGRRPRGRETPRQRRGAHRGDDRPQRRPPRQPIPVRHQQPPAQRPPDLRSLQRTRLGGPAGVGLPAL